MIGVEKETENLVLLNKMNKNSLLTFLGLILFSYNAFSLKEKKLNCVEDINKEMALVFANGMFTDEKSAFNSLKVLKRKTNFRFKNYDLAYNQNESRLLQVLEVIEQKMDSAKKFLWSFMSDYDGPEWLNESLAIQNSLIDSKNFLKDVDLRKHLSLYKKYLNEKDSNVIIVSHSQGNFYANQAFDILEKNIENIDEKVHIVSVANPDSKVRGTPGEYKTLKSDGVIKLIPLAMKANSENTMPKPGILDHGFLKHYIHAKPTGDEILNIINKTASDSLSDKYYFPIGYVDASLHAMNRWVKKLEDKEVTRSLKKHECLAVSLFLKNKSWFGETCKDRSFQAVKEYGNWCLENEWSKKVENTCIIYGQLPGIGGGMAHGMELFSGDHEECRWDSSTLSEELNDAVLANALKFIKNPVNN